MRIARPSSIPLASRALAIAIAFNRTGSGCFASPAGNEILSKALPLNFDPSQYSYWLQNKERKPVVTFGLRSMIFFESGRNPI